jgi:hypothetical protein
MKVTRTECAMNVAAIDKDDWLSPLVVRLRAAILGEHGVTVASISASATCDRGGPKVPDVGAGPNWICMITFTDDHGQPRRASSRSRPADATYVAGGPSKLVGLATTPDAHGNNVTNRPSSSTEPSTPTADRTPRSANQHDRGRWPSRYHLPRS